MVTRQMPYQGKTPASVAVGVIRDHLRPPIPAEIHPSQMELIELIESCWHQDPVMRPAFLV